MKPTTIQAFKGFAADWSCRGFKYGEPAGQSFTTDTPVTLCHTGFHVYEAPLDVFNYYSPADSKYAAVELTGATGESSDDSKRVGAGITLKAALTIAGLVSAHVKYVNSNLKKGHKISKRAEESAACNTGNRSAACNTGNRSAASNTGYQSATSNTGNRSAASNTGEDGIAAALGLESKAKGGPQSILIVAWHDGKRKRKRTTVGYVGEDGIKPDTWYRAGKNGELVLA